MPTHHLDFSARHDPAANSTTISWRLRITGVAEGSFYDVTTEDQHIECLWNDMHDVSVRCAAQKALGHFVQHSGMLEPF